MLGRVLHSCISICFWLRGARPSVGFARFLPELPELDKLDQRVILEFLAAAPHLLAVVWVVLDDVPDLLTDVETARDLRGAASSRPANADTPCSCMVNERRPLTLT